VCLYIYMGAGKDVGISNICSTSPRHSLQVSLANTTAHPAAAPPELALSPTIIHTHTLSLSLPISLSPPMIDLRRMRDINRRTLYSYYFEFSRVPGDSGPHTYYTYTSSRTLSVNKCIYIYISKCIHT